MKIKQTYSKAGSVQDDHGSDNPNWLAKSLRSIGPGVITAALVFGPGSLTIASRLGARFGFALLWVLVISTLFMLVFTAMAARIGMATEQSLLGVIREKWGKPIALVIGLGIFLVTASFQAGNTIGASIAFAELFHTPVQPWVIVFTLAAVSLLFVKAFYQVLERIMLLLVGLMLFSFLTTLLLARPGFSQILVGLIPGIPSGAEMLVIALIASSFSIVGAFYQSYLVQERRRHRPEVRATTNDSFTGIIILGLMGSVVLASAAAVLHPQGLEVNTAADMGRALEPLFGAWASTLFMAGLFGASFSSLIGNATIGGSLLGDAFGWGSRLQSNAVKYLIALVMIFGAAIAFAFGRLPLELIVFAQGVTIFIVPFVGIAIFVLANDNKLMGGLENSLASKIAGGVGLLVLFLLAFSNVKGLFF